MALYAIADLHLSTLESTNKSMEVFGKRWADYMNRIEVNWRRLITEDDTVVIPGDISWALSLEEAVSDLKFIDSLPGKKILGKGNHDFWWCTMKKHRELFEREGINSVSFLFNNAYETEDFIIAGSRGWFYDEKCDNSKFDTDFEKLTARELQRLKTSLDAAAKLSCECDKEIVVFTHFPPVFSDFVSEEVVALLKEYGIKRLYYGHIHGNYTLPASFMHEGIEMNIISADYLGFTPKYIAKNS